MSAGTRLARVVPWDAHGIIDKEGNASGQFVARDVADVQARDYDTSFSHRAPHTVQQLARVVRVVAVDDAMVERIAEHLFHQFEFDPQKHNPHVDEIPEDRRQFYMRVAEATLRAAALTPPEA